MVSQCIDLVYNSIILFSNEVFFPLFNAFELRTLILLLFGVVLVVRFLLMPLLGIRPFNADAGSDLAISKRNNQLALEHKVPRLEDKGGF